MRLVCREFTRILGLVTESLRLPSACLSPLLPPSACQPASFHWACVCPKLTTIIITCAALRECQGLIDILYSDDKLPFWEIFSAQPVELAPFSEHPLQPSTNAQSPTTDIPAAIRSTKVQFEKHVGFEVNMHLSTASSDGLVIIQGLLSCLNKCCGRDLLSHSTLFIRHLNVSETNITDACLEKCYPMLPLLEFMDCRRCQQLQFPLRSAVAPSLNIKKVLFDGCWQIDEMHLKNYENSYYGCHFLDDSHHTSQHDRGNSKPPLFIDVLHDQGELELIGAFHAEVVILVPPYIGEWVRCTITHKHPLPQTDTCSKGGGDRSHFAKYDIFVWETLKYNHAVGFSSSPALNISRQHLRSCVL